MPGQICYPCTRVGPEPPGANDFGQAPSARQLRQRLAERQERHGRITEDYFVVEMTNQYGAFSLIVDRNVDPELFRMTDHFRRVRNETSDLFYQVLRRY